MDNMYLGIYLLLSAGLGGIVGGLLFVAAFFAETGHLTYVFV